MAERRWVLYSDFPNYWRCRNGDSPKLGAASYKTVEVMPVTDHLKAIEETRKQVVAEVEEALTSALAKVREEFERPPSGHGREAEEEWTERVELAMDQVDAALATLKGGTDV